MLHEWIRDSVADIVPPALSTGIRAFLSHIDPMQLDESRPPTLSGHLLLAEPGLRDPNFWRSVVLITDHDSEQGAHGYVLTQPLGQTVGEVVDHPEVSALADVPVFAGGPVSPSKLSFVSLAWNAGRQALEVATHLSGAEAVARRTEGFVIRAFAGYSGWSEGQLEAELGQGSWITTPAGPAILDATDPAGLWGVVMRSLGPYYHLLAGMPDNVSLN